jgi:Protein of unknown function (DUF3987)
MPRACVEGWLHTYVRHARHTEAPEKFHFWAGVSTLAGALRRKVYIDQLTYEYTPNFYIVLVAPAGVSTKSTTIRQGISLLREVQGIHLGPQSLTWQALLDSLHQAQEVYRVPGTTEVLTAACLTIAASELGTLVRPENREYLDHLTAMWDGQKEQIKRKTVMHGETAIENPWLNIIAGTTPSWLKDNFHEALVGGGFASRIIFVYSDRKRQLVAYPKRQVRDVAQYKIEHKALLHDLQQIALLAGEYELTEEAYSYGEKWYLEHHNVPRNGHLSSERYQGYLSRKQAHIHKLAIILAASRGDERTIGQGDLVEAEAHITALEADMKHVFDSIGVTQDANVSNEVINRIRHSGEASYKALGRAVSQTIGGDAYKKTIQHALDLGIITRSAMPGGDFMLKYVKRGE